MAWFSKKEASKPAAASTSTVDVDARVELPELSRALSSNDRAFLVTCCDESIAGTITWAELGEVRRVRFRRVDGDQLHLVVDNDGGTPYECRPRTQVVVSYFYRDRAACFVAYEESKGAGQRQELVVLRIPTQIAVEGRTRFRIPILPKLELTVALIHENRRIRVPHAIDISIAGMMLAFTKDMDPGLEADHQTHVELSLEGDTYRVPCTIRNRIVRPSETRYGILFHNGSNGFDFEQDTELNDMIMGIERYYVRNRNK